jgi:hypothetical protein
MCCVDYRIRISDRGVIVFVLHVHNARGHTLYDVVRA